MGTSEVVKTIFKIATLKSWKINIFEGENWESGGLNASSEKLTWKNLGVNLGG